MIGPCSPPPDLDDDKRATPVAVLREAIERKP
jgi:hypothetical protein